MKKAILLFLLVPNLLFAHPIDGKWLGEGEAQTTKYHRICSEIYMYFALGEGTIDIKSGGYACEDMVAEYPYSRFQLQDGLLIYKGQQVGRVLSDGLFINYMDTDGVIYILDLKVDQNKMEYREYWSDGRSFLKISGELDTVD